MAQTESTETEPYVPTLLDYVDDFFVSLSPAWVLVDSLGLIALGVWLGRNAYPWFLLLRALRTAPLATVKSGASGIVKLQGHAYPGSEHAPSRLTNTPYVWCVYEKFDTRSIRGSGSSGSYSVAPMLLRDATGECVVNPQEAVVVHTLVKGRTDRHMFSGSTSQVERLILPGDAVIAIGELHGAREKADPGARAPYRLRKPKGGVLLYSGKSEQRTLLRFRIFFWPAAAAAALCALLGLRGLAVHVDSYPAPEQYFNALLTRPGMSYPGPQTNKQ